MTSPMSALSMNAARQQSTMTRLTIAGLVTTAGAMLLQIASGSTLYPSVTGPIVLLVTALVVAFVPGRWPAYLGLAVPLVLGLGAIVAAVMTGDFIEQLTDIGKPALFAGSVLHVLGLIAAVAGAVGMTRGPQVAADGGR